MKNHDKRRKRALQKQKIIAEKRINKVSPKKTLPGMPPKNPKPSKGTVTSNQETAVLITEYFSFAHVIGGSQ